MRKHLILLAAVALMATAATAQSATDHYPRLEVGASLQYCHDFAHGKPNLGADLRLTCQLTDVLRIRALANVNGFVPDGFDRYGTATVGLSAEYSMVYGFADFGLSLNPSSTQPFNPAADIGVGLRFDLARRHHLFAETGFAATATGTNAWNADYFLKIGYTVTITKPLPQWPITTNSD